MKTINKKLLKKTVVLVLSVITLSLCFTSCPSSTNSGNSGSIKICLIGADTSKTWNVWAWKEKGDTDENYCESAWPGGDIQLTNTDDTNGFIYTTMNIDSDYALGILFVASTDETVKTSDITVPSSVLSSTNTLYFIYGDTNYYTDMEKIKGIKSAEVTSSDGNTITATIFGSSSVSTSDFTVADSTGASLTVSDASISSTNVTLTLTNGNLSNIPYTVTYGGVSVLATISIDLIDGSFVPSDDVVKKLGVTTSNSTATFKTWAPLASKVTLLLFTDSSSLTASASTTEMSKGNSGVWSVENVDVSSYKYYKYRIVNSGTSYDVCDIWAKCASADSVASEIIDINSDSNAIYSGTKDSVWGTQEGYYNPFGEVTGSSVATKKSYTDAVVYEMHIRDWSRVEVTDSTGKFLDIANGTKVIEHLKDLGITHVQILPMFDYAQKNSNTSYNWGYNPYNYNVPEGRYVTSDYADGTQAVKEMRTLISKLHEAGIAVNMDVVYNHTSGTGSSSLYDMTVPEYFYRVADGSYSNGSGCGNEIATNHAMVKKFVIDSLKHWMLDFHINGFRFDLMGCAEKSTMKDIYDELYKIDPNVMVYGEPWTGGTSAVEDGASCAVSGTSGIGAGAFDDSFRDAIKGAEFGGFEKGQIQGTFNDNAICTGLKGSTCTRNSTGDIDLGLHYVECHDNYTLFDKLSISLNKGTSSSSWKAYSSFTSDQQETLRSEDKLAAAFVLLSQGTPFINGGQEFLRTKQGNDNSYISSDTINQIDLSMKDTYSDVYNTYKGLIALRKANLSDFGKNSSATATTPVTGVTKYTSGDFLVYFNTTDSSYTIAATDTTGYTTLVDVSTGAVTTSATLPTNVPAKSFVIMKK